MSWLKLLCMVAAVSFGGAAYAQSPPFFGDGAVGFDPEISIVNSGALLDAQVVVSDDRRYVTITAMPSLSRIGALNTFPVLQGAGVGGGAAGTGAARLGFVGGAGYIDDAANDTPQDVRKPAQSKASAERAAHAERPPPVPKDATETSPAKILMTDSTAHDSVLRKEGMFLLSPAR